MPLTQKAIDELKEIYKRKYGRKLSNQEALDIEMDLIDLFKVIYKPLLKNKNLKKIN